MRPFMLLGFAFAACTSVPEAMPPESPVAPPPATSIAGGGDVAPRCTYTEAYDASNDYRAASGYVLEETGLIYGGAKTTICGQINNGHFDTSDYAVDIDNYGVAIATDSDVIVALTGNAQNVSSVGVWAYDPTTQATAAGGYFVYDHGVFSAHLPAGNYEISVEAYDNQDIEQAIPYTLTIAGDAPAARCATMLTAPDYSEAHDGASNRGNDVVSFDYSQFPSTAMANNGSTPEAMGLVLDTATTHRISGVSANVAELGSYLDRDTYAFTTGAETDQVSVRLDWTNTSADLDYYIFAEGSSFPLASAATPVLGGGEFATFAVAPNTRYWLWVGAYADSTVPAAYNATVCADTFAP
jgi:hypothetical protein